MLEFTFIEFEKVVFFSLVSVIILNRKMCFECLNSGSCADTKTSSVAFIHPVLVLWLPPLENQV